MQLTQRGFNPEYSEQAPTAEQLSELSGYALLEFGAPWCGHCQQAFAAVKDVMTAYSHIAHVKIYDGKGKILGRQFSVKLWPTLILLHDGKELARIIRPTTANQVRELFANLSGLT